MKIVCGDCGKGYDTPEGALQCNASHQKGATMPETAEAKVDAAFVAKSVEKFNTLPQEQKAELMTLAIEKAQKSLEALLFALRQSPVTANQKKAIVKQLFGKALKPKGVGQGIDDPSFKKTQEAAIAVALAVIMQEKGILVADPTRMLLLLATDGEVQVAPRAPSELWLPFTVRGGMSLEEAEAIRKKICNEIPTATGASWLYKERGVHQGLLVDMFRKQVETELNLLRAPKT